MSRGNLEKLKRLRKVGPAGRPFTPEERELLEAAKAEQDRELGRLLLAKLPPPGPLPRGFAALQVFAPAPTVPQLLERMPAGVSILGTLAAKAEASK